MPLRQERGRNSVFGRSQSGKVKGKRDFRSLLIGNLDIPENRHGFLPRGFQTIGHIAIINPRPEARDLAKDIAGVILKSFPYVKTVCLSGSIEGDLREPGVAWLAGDRGTETIHRENRCRYRLDVSRVMFSKGNLSERGRVPGLVKPGEVVADLFAGIGYFSIPIARHSRARRVYSIEKNPAAFHYLKENAFLNRVQDRLTPILGDCREFRMGGVADRVIMGYLPGTHDFLTAAFDAMKPEGGTIHYHDTFHESELWDRPLGLLSSSGLRHGYALEGEPRRAVVKEHSPGIYHVVIDARFAKM